MLIAVLQMRAANLVLAPYIDTKIVAAIHQAVGVPVPEASNAQSSSAASDRIAVDIRSR